MANIGTGACALHSCEAVTLVRLCMSTCSLNPTRPYDYATLISKQHAVYAVARGTEVCNCCYNVSWCGA